MVLRESATRVSLFGRFCNLYEESDALCRHDYRRYLDLVDYMQKALTNFTISEWDEVVLLPLKTALDHFTKSFTSWLSPKALEYHSKKVSKKHFSNFSL
jgi:hypothetical protein